MKNKLSIKTKAVIFDMDGVITNTMPDHFRSWIRIFKEEGINVSELDIYKREGQPGINSVLEIFKENKLVINPNRARFILAKKEKLFKRLAKRRFITGARSFVRFVHKLGFSLALVTGTSRHELHQILPRYLCNLFDIIITGDDVHRGKPHPEPYKKALNELKLSPSDAVVIENSPFGIESAKKAGIRCLALETSLPDTYLNAADGIFANIEELQQTVTFIKEN